MGSVALAKAVRILSVDASCGMLPAVAALGPMLPAFALALALLTWPAAAAYVAEAGQVVAVYPDFETHVVIGDCDISAAAAGCLEHHLRCVPGQVAGVDLEIEFRMVDFDERMAMAATTLPPGDLLRMVFAVGEREIRLPVDAVAFDYNPVDNYSPVLVSRSAPEELWTLFADVPGGKAGQLTLTFGEWLFDLTPRSQDREILRAWAATCESGLRR